MLMLRVTSKLGLMILAIVAGCYEEGAFDPLSKADMAKPPTSTYRELSFLATKFTSDATECQADLSSNGLKITASSGTPSCTFKVNSLNVPSYSGSYRVRSGIIPTQMNSTSPVRYSLTVNDITLFSMDVPLYAMGVPLKTGISDFSITGNPGVPLNNSTKVAFSITFSGATAVTINKLAFEFDVPTPTEGTL